MMTITTLSQSSILTNNNKWHIETLNNEPAEDFTKPNLTKRDKEKMVPLIDRNSCEVTVSKLVQKEKYKAKYKLGMRTRSNQYNTKLEDNN